MIERLARFIAAAMTLTILVSGCGGGGGSSSTNGGGLNGGGTTDGGATDGGTTDGGTSGGGAIPDTDGDGIPDNQDAFPADAAKFASYVRLDLPGLTGSTFSTAAAINDGDLIVGASNDLAGDIHPIMWVVVGNTIIPSRLENNSNFGAAYDLNNTGDVVGEAANASAGRDAILWRAAPQAPTGSASPLVLPPIVGARFSAAYGINNTRRIVGESQSAGLTRAVTWTLAGAGATVTPSQPLLLGEPAGGIASSAYFVGEDNRIVGEYTVNGAVHGVLWALSADGTTVAARLDLPPLPGDTQSVAYGINADGVIVGESTSPAGVVHGVIWTVAGTVVPATALATPAEGAALAINDAGRMTGWSTPTVGGTAMASVWDVRNPGLRDSVLAPGGFSQGFGINNAGIVVGMAGNSAFVGVPR